MNWNSKRLKEERRKGREQVIQTVRSVMRLPGDTPDEEVTLKAMEYSLMVPHLRAILDNIAAGEGSDAEYARKHLKSFDADYDTAQNERN